MLAAGLRAGRQVEDLAGRPAGRRHDVGHGRAAEGQGAGLVEDHGVDLVGDLERLAAADEDAGLGAAAGPDHDRRRRGQPRAHGQAMTTTAMNEVRARVSRGSGPNRSHTTNVPAGDEEHGRDEHLGDAVGEALDGRLAALGPPDEVDDAGERRVAADGRGAHDERAGRVARRADDLGPGSDLDRDRLAGEHARVDRRGALDEDAVDRHASRPARTRRRSPTTTASSATSASRPSVSRCATRAWSPMSRRMAPVAPAFARASSQRPEQDQADDDRRRVEVGLRVQARLVDDGGEGGHHDAVRPGRASCPRPRACPCSPCRGGTPARPVDRSAGRPRTG